MDSTGPSQERRLKDIQPRPKPPPPPAPPSREASHKPIATKSPTKLLFIDHYDETTDPAIRKLAYAHVQHNRTRRRREAALERLHLGLETIAPQHAAEGSKNSKKSDAHAGAETEEDENVDSIGANKDHGPSNRSRPIAIKRRRTSFRRRERGTSQMQVMTHKAQPHTMLDPSDPDPFSSGSQSIPRATHFLLIHYVRDMMFSLSNSRAYSHEHNRWLVPIALEDPLVLGGITAMASANILQLSKGIPRVDQFAEHQLLQNKISLIRTINQNLDRPVHELGLPTFFAMFGLMVTELLAGSMEAAKPHIKGVVKLGEIKGGWESLPTFFMGQVLMYMNAVAVITKTKPQIQPPPMQIEFSPTTKGLICEETDPNLSSLAVGFDAACPSILAPELLEVIRDAAEDAILTDFLSQHDKLLPLPDLRAAQQRRWHFHYKRLNFPFREGREKNLGHDPHRDAAQECCRLATSLFTFGFARGLIHPTSPVLRSIITQLRAMLDQSNLHNFWHPHEEMLFWVLFMAANSCGGQAEYPWIIMQLARGAKILECHDWETVRLIMLRFLYADRYFRDPLREVWTAVEMHKSMMAG